MSFAVPVVQGDVRSRRAIAIDLQSQHGIQTTGRVGVGTDPRLGGRAQTGSHEINKQLELATETQSSIETT
ncbi:MAG: hypothetical protein QM736_18610 [Vicinamibacterales bacterium]